MSPSKHDSLDAVARVRRVRERDSLTGLQHAVREVAQAQARVAALDARLDSAPSGAVASPVEDMDSFVATRSVLLAVEHALTHANTCLESSQNLAHSALAHWQSDKSRLKAIEMLQERRREAARAEAARAEAKELDDIAAQLWQRRHGREAVA
jgi:flagellar export protein FliJ